MKRLILCGFLAVVCWPAQAQLFSREALGGAALGGVVGGIIGHNSRGRTAEGVGIGAGAGLVLGSLLHNARDENGYCAAQVPVAAAPGYYAYTPAYYQPARPNYALSGAALGGIAGGIIGHNQGGRTMEGVGIGAGAGLLLGGLAEQHARRHERIYYIQPVVTYPAPVVVAPAPVVTAPTPIAAAPAPAASAVQTAGNTPGQTTPPMQTIQQPAIANNLLGSSGPMSSANSLFGR
jgi:uncharacterized protein YcfJ